MTEPVSDTLQVGALQVRPVWRAWRGLPAATYIRAVPIAIGAALLIGLPSDLIPNPVFGRPVAIRPIDYGIWVVTSLLIGLTLAIRPAVPASAVVDLADPPEDDLELDDGVDTRAVWGGFVSFLAVGCPVCNQAVVALVGTSGALSWWAPVQPLVGALAVVLLLIALRKRLLTHDLLTCALPGAGRGRSAGTLSR